MPALVSRVPPRRLVFSGGGIRVISYIGMLEVLEEQGLLKHVREFCGVSAGAFSAMMLALGYSIPAMKQFSLEFDFSSLRSVEPELALQFMESYGIDDGQQLRRVLETMLKHKGFGPETTFQQLAESRRCKELRVWAADLEMMEPAEFSAKATPNVSIVTAVHASMAYPVYFIPVEHPETGHILTDGGVFDNYPISFLTEEEAQQSLGVTFELKERARNIQEFGDFMARIFAGYYMPSYQRLVEQYKDRTIVIPCAEFPALHFEASMEEKHHLIEMGRQATEAFCKALEPVAGRRRSVA